MRPPQATGLPGGAVASFDLLALRFRFRARGRVFFPPGKAGNVVRGAFGSALHRIAPPDEYARIFEPAKGGPSGLADSPRPFVFRASHLDGVTFEPGQAFYITAHLFDLKAPVEEYFRRTFEALGAGGLGPGRGRADLYEVDETPVSVDLSAAKPSVERAAVRFLTPTELKSGASLAERPEFAILFARIRDRVSTLRALYGPGALDIDFRGMGERAAGVRLLRCALRREESRRTSGRTGQTHPLGGFTGEAEYEGALGEFVPYLEAARWTGVGRQTVWGKGALEVRLF